MGSYLVHMGLNLGPCGLNWFGGSCAGLLLAELWNICFKEGLQKDPNLSALPSSFEALLEPMVNFCQL